MPHSLKLTQADWPATEIAAAGAEQATTLASRTISIPTHPAADRYRISSQGSIVSTEYECGMAYGWASLACGKFSVALKLEFQESRLPCPPVRSFQMSA